LGSESKSKESKPKSESPFKPKKSNSQLDSESKPKESKSKSESKSKPKYESVSKPNEPELKSEPLIEPEIVENSKSVDESLSNEPIEAEVIDSVPLEEATLEDMSMEGSFGERFQKLLHEANLTTRHVKFCCGGVIVVAVVIFLALVLIPKFLSGDISFFNNDDDVIEVTDENPDEEVSDDEEKDVEVADDDVVVSEDGPVWVDASIYAGLLTGDTSLELTDDTGVDSGILVGDDEEADHLSLFQDYVADLEDVYNLYFVDVVSLLDSASNRTKALDDHISELKGHYNGGVDNYEAIQAMKDTLSEPFNENEPIKEAESVAFFDALSVERFDGKSAEEHLLEFISLKQVQADLKAKHLAYSKLEEMYEVVLSSMAVRIEDVQLNREALISGVQVVDVEGSDLDLILSESDLEG